MLRSFKKFAQFMIRLKHFLELGKFKIVELWFGFWVGVSLLGPMAIASSRATATLVLILGVGIAVIAATCSLDDIVGVRDGVDQANHRVGPRWGVKKPLLTGHLNEKQAFRFVHFLGILGLFGFGATLAVAWPIPGWIIASIIGIILVVLNYSYGLKLSYRGMGEAVILLGGAGTVLAPYALVAREVTPLLLFEALLVGAWHAQVVMFSNTFDAAGDRSQGRMTIAARTSPRGNKIFICSIFLLFWLVTVGAFYQGWLPPRLLWALIPVWILQMGQLRLGVVQEQWLSARRLGFMILRLGILGLSGVNWSF